MACMKNCMREEAQIIFFSKFLWAKKYHQNIEIWENLGKLFDWWFPLTFPDHNGRFIRILKFLGLSATQAMSLFSLTIIKDIEPGPFTNRKTFISFLKKAKRSCSVIITA